MMGIMELWKVEFYSKKKAPTPVLYQSGGFVIMMGIMELWKVEFHNNKKKKAPTLVVVYQSGGYRIIMDIMELELWKWSLSQ